MNNRCLALNNIDMSGECVIYVMSRDQRAHDNHALLQAQNKALDLKLPLIVVFNLLSNSGVRGYEHAEFMIKGLERTTKILSDFDIGFIMTNYDKVEGFSKQLVSLKPAAIYFDFSPLHGPRSWAKAIAGSIKTKCVVVDTHNIIPVWVASDHQEFAAYTFRPKVHKVLQEYLVEPEILKIHPYKSSLNFDSIDFMQAYKIIDKYPKRGININYDSGEESARLFLDKFITKRLDKYANSRNDMAVDNQSGLSPYLHFGQISSLRVALEVLNTAKTTPLLYEMAKMPKPSEVNSASDGMNVLFEEMIVRKELSDNFCFYAKNYKNFGSVHDWAKLTLDLHSQDKRVFEYSLDELTNYQTHDRSWNAAQKELVNTGKIHGYMRMYWAKKILEWTENPKQALEFCIYLNDAYSIDGGNPNGYVGILWAIAGVHDRPWTERPIFGKIRYMNEAGLKRKFDIDSYIERINNI